jgi:hypothetical protein
MVKLCCALGQLAQQTIRVLTALFKTFITTEDTHRPIRMFTVLNVCPKKTKVIIGTYIISL